MTPLTRRRERRLVGVLAAAAAARVLLFCAAFPFFTNVDEHRHVDVVLKYARGWLPRPGAEAYEPEMGTLVGLYGSPEYHLPPERRGRGAPPPAWRAPRAEMVRRIQTQEAFFAARPNLEVFESPAYYAVAGAWLRLGRALGLEGARLLYWVRALSAIATLLLVLATWGLLRELYPGDAFARLGVPVLLAAFPQDALYYVTRDALSPLAAGASFVALTHLARRPGAPRPTLALAGLLAAAAFLVKYTNLAVFAVAVCCTAMALRSPVGARRWLAFWVAAAVPVALWWLRNQLLLGDFLGSAFKVAGLGWGRAGLAALPDHPLLTGAGAAAFVSDLLPHFWRGELAWYRHVLAHPGVDRLYTVSSLVFPLAATWGLWRGRGSAPDGGRLAEGLALVMVATSVAALALLSLLFEFHETSNPPASRPFFVQGRLIAGALVPFSLLYVRGIGRLASRLPPKAAPLAAWGCLAAVVVVSLASEVALSRDVFASAYNWFHLP